MKPFLPSRRLVAGALILLVAIGSHALTLGRSQGLALIGRPLALSVPIGLDAGTDSSTLCAEAEVFYGGQRVDPARVSAWLDAVAGTSGVVRVRSAAPVDEPAVTVYLHVGCGQRVTRRYVLLAERPGDAVPQPPARPAPAFVPATGTAASVSVAAVPATAPAPAPARARARRLAASDPAPSTSPRALSAARAHGRLTLEPLDPGTGDQPSLKASTSMQAWPEATPQQRAEAAAFWEALNASPQDVLRGAQHVRSMEADVIGMRERLQKNNASLAELQGQLEQARTERFANPLVYALLGLLGLLAVVGALVFGWGWGRAGTGAGAGNGSPDSWSGVRESDFASEFPQEGSLPPLPMADSPAGPGKTPAPSLDARSGFADSAPGQRLSGRTAGRPSLPENSRSGSPSGGFSHSGLSGLRAVKAEEVVDIQQQADFFISLGEFEQAIEVLRSHINVHPETSAVAWLDLLDIYHQLERREDYEATRQEFHDAFNAQVPPFGASSEPGQGLEDYPQVLMRIVALWPTARALEIIEESIFRKPGQDGSQPFGLNAYRELLLLFNIGKELVASGDSRLGIASSGGAGRDLPAPALDIDLDEPGEPEPDFGDSMSLLPAFDLPDPQAPVLRPEKKSR